MIISSPHQPLRKASMIRRQSSAASLLGGGERVMQVLRFPRTFWRSNPGDAQHDSAAGLLLVLFNLKHVPEGLVDHGTRTNALDSVPVGKECSYASPWIFDSGYQVGSICLRLVIQLTVALLTPAVTSAQSARRMTLCDTNSDVAWRETSVGLCGCASDDRLRQESLIMKRHPSPHATQPDL
ncbi:hypothetical protein CGCF415_v015626 [Colletotrichum fructicola]|nr:hypothetical protein CGCF415_v015626 [Colletotrichum fructicola]